MGVRITSMFSDYGQAALTDVALKKNSVFHLANQALKHIVDKEIEYSHLVAATSCPDAIAPSLGQCINQQYNSPWAILIPLILYRDAPVGYQRLYWLRNSVNIIRAMCWWLPLMLLKKLPHHPAKYLSYSKMVFLYVVFHMLKCKKLIHHQSRQYKDLYNVVTIGLGHDADAIIAANIEEVATDSRKHLGLKLNNHLAIKLMKEAEGFYLDFISKTGHPDILILHQVNELIINHLQQVFAKYPTQFINMAKETGNCGCATTGIVLDHLKNKIENKKVMICSFGTGGVITAGLWQF